MMIPRLRTNYKTIEEAKYIRATALAPRKRTANMEHLIPVPKADSVIMVEITPNNTESNLHLLLSHEKIPTYRSFMFHANVAHLPANETLGFIILK